MERVILSRLTPGHARAAGASRTGPPYISMLPAHTGLEARANQEWWPWPPYSPLMSGPTLFPLAKASRSITVERCCLSSSQPHSLQGGLLQGEHQEEKLQSTKQQLRGSPRMMPPVYSWAAASIYATAVGVPRDVGQLEQGARQGCPRLPPWSSIASWWVGTGTASKQMFCLTPS